ncbi:MAG: glycosyl transferase family 2, partial [Ramlibacter sp.]|nr:glycosyl transferase family 2 [Ramlibacter sp.]
PVRPGCWRVRHPLPSQPPLVSIIVPTRDALALTRLCIDSVRRHTRYPRYEILLVDNQSTDADALAWMRSQDEAGAIRLLRYDAPFNYAAINNMAVQQAAGELVCLLNNDTEVMQPGWLEEMVSHALQAGVDVVGAKLLYPNGLVQHAGDLVGVGGLANHAHAFLPSDAPGYCDRAVVAQEYSAVTAACLLTWRSRYLALGGLDAAHLPVAFNDVDYCLRVREAGGRVVWTPHAVLVHHESVSRGKDLSRQQLRRARREAAWMRRRWRHVLGRDPFYNPNLSHERPDFSLSHAPVVDQPWTS